MPADLTIQNLDDEGVVELLIETDETVISVAVTEDELDRLQDQRQE